MDRGALALVPFWERVEAGMRPGTLTMIGTIADEADSRRARAEYDTGSITTYEACLLMTLATHLSARVVIEVGTFVGLSTVALAQGLDVEAVYTCDASNDCLESNPVIRTYPKQTSTRMLTDLVNRAVKADLCFFDGVLASEDIPLLLRLSTPETVYAFHDYNYGPKIRKGGILEPNVPRKGIGNVKALWPTLSGYSLVTPLKDTTLALLVPESTL